MYSDSHNDRDTYLLFLIFSFNCDKIKGKKKEKMQQHRAIVSSEKSENGIVIMSDGK